MEIIIGSDHGGYDLKEGIKGFLSDSDSYIVQDIGTFSRDPVDYPDIAHKVARNISEKRFEKGILICGSGIGMSIVANRYKNVRAALCHNLYTVRLSRAHNNANVLALGGRILGIGLATEMVDLFLNTDFEGGRHQKRIDKINI